MYVEFLWYVEVKYKKNSTKDGKSIIEIMQLEYSYIDFEVYY